MSDRLTAIYHIHSGAPSIEARAQAIAVEQSVEMPVSAIDDPGVLRDIVGKVEEIADRGDGSYTVRIGLAVATTGPEIGQLMNMLFGNTSIHDDVALEDVEIPPGLLAAFGGPRVGLDGLKARVGAGKRAMTCTALKPQGLPAAKLAAIAGRCALGGIDFIKDDHGLADQRYSPFVERARRCAEAVAAACRVTGRATRYLPSLSGNLDQLREQVRIALGAGLDSVLIAPMLVGLPSLHALRREFPALAIMAHPALAGAARIAPPLLLGKLFRLFGVDATVFPNHGGRFGYTPAICRAIADQSRKPVNGIAACAPVPAGGMTTDRVPEMLDFYGPDVMLLIGGGLLAARERLTEATASFQSAVERYTYP
jgi:ribulose-bisphosphate carboxylase large chain